MHRTLISNVLIPFQRRSCALTTSPDFKRDLFAMACARVAEEQCSFAMTAAEYGSIGEEFRGCMLFVKGRTTTEKGRTRTRSTVDHGPGHCARYLMVASRR